MEYNLFQNRVPLLAAQKLDGWKVYEFDDILIDDTKNALKVKKEDYLEQGQYSIVDQGQMMIAGYRDNPDGIYETSSSIIFGDHTRIIKYIDFPLFLGADGVKLLKCKFDKSIIDMKYIYYFLKTIELPSDGYSRHFKYLKQVFIPVPPINKQKQIVDLLDRSQNLILKRKEQLEICDELIKSQFIEMFGDPRTNPYNWEKSSIGDCYYVRGGKRIPKGMGYSDEITEHPYLRATDMKNATILDDDIRYISDEVYDKIKNYTVSGGDIYLTNVGVNLGMAGVIPDKYEGANLTENAVKLVPKQERLTGMFIAYYINSPGIQEYVNERKMSVGVPKLAIFRIESMPVIIPPLELQNKFTDFVKQINKLKFEMEQSLVELENNFNSLMQRAFKGELF